MAWGCKRRLLLYCCFLIGLLHSFSPGYAEQRGPISLSTVKEGSNGSEENLRPVFEEGGDGVFSLLEIIEERKKAWALTKAKGEGKPQIIHCGSAVYGHVTADETVTVNPEEAPNCRSLCRALLHKVFNAFLNSSPSPLITKYIPVCFCLQLSLYIVMCPTGTLLPDWLLRLQLLVPGLVVH
ncbi:uncharacterized protein EMH_0088700 [Eimeria mitis]|uniref:SAG family member n=1 Tax=Eimeria mitis TaxID=44415 RepID=U6KJT2_9EIME|nr:uncharacterized protein EMH_0088700 [Eimeria mitis]CDJ36517.1 hypothetical protein EMH_0088700 [Eimeria mitis]